MSWFWRDRGATEHRYVQERLSAYLDRELSSREQGYVEHHLATCPHCRRELDTLRRTVEWTMELPVVPVPRAFTIPVAAPARRAPVGQRAWRLPVLQGATALVALLFVLAVVGEAFLPGMLPASAPAPAVYEREAALQAEATQVVDLMQEAVEVTIAVEMVPPAPQETPPPGAEQAVAKAAEDAALAASTAAPAGMGPGIRGGEVQETQVVEATEPAPGALMGISASLDLTATATTAPTATPEPSLTPTAAATATAEPSPTAVPSPTAAPSPTPSPEAVVVVAAEAPSEISLSAPAPDTAETPRRPALRWLAIAEIVLGAAFVVLGTLTVVLMARRLRRT
jgi:hypothetical protein